MKGFNKKQGLFLKKIITNLREKEIIKPFLDILPNIFSKIFLLPLLFWLVLASNGCSHRGDTAPDSPKKYDIVIMQGRVIDAESNLDAIRNIGISKGVIQIIIKEPLIGKTVIDATGLIVSPGFIDLHCYRQDKENYRIKVMDGVTTVLDLEYGTSDVGGWYGVRAGEALINYGACIGHVAIRKKVMGDPGFPLPVADGAYKTASKSELFKIKQQIEYGLKRGAVEVGFAIEYTPMASYQELLELFRFGAKYGATCCVHLRYSGDKSIQALEEVIELSANSGASVHVAHITGTALRSTSQLLKMIRDARLRGMDITTGFHPYNAGQTRIESAIFNEGWQKVFGIDYKDLEWVDTGERLTKESFERYRKVGGRVIGHNLIHKDVVKEAMLSPLTMIISDGKIKKGTGHPRGAGTYSYVLGRFVREAKILTWMEALRKMTLMPAKRLEGRVPMMKNKGRIRVGADADITIFNPERIIDRSTFREPARYSEGIKYVLVNGVLVVKDGKIRGGVAPGKPIRGPIKR
ncbi:MAG: D-glutamate deacylase [Desulfobacteraceae bacterium]|nr:MAG: D-glutamate deacylase [Desulfobacteraceae bacterium]